MNSVSITQLKTNPAKAVRKSIDSPVAVENRNKVEAYLIGKDLYESIVSYLEDLSDRKAVESTDFSKGKDFDVLAKELNL